MSNITNLLNISATQDQTHSWSTMKVLTAIIYPTIILLSTVGNIIVILTVIRSAAMRTITNLFIANLALSDLLMTFVSTPFTPIAFYMKTWNLPEIMCRLLPITMGTSLYVSTLTSTAIAVDRYLVIVHPFFTRMSERICGVIIFLVWLFSVLITMPLAIYQEASVDPRTHEVRCLQTWPAEASQALFTVVTFVLQFVVPCLVISICYYRVSCVLRARCEVKIGSGQKSREKEESEIKRKRRTNNMLIAMVVIFVICWIPLHVLWIVVDTLHTDVDNSAIFDNAFIWCHMVAMSSTVYNPFLYAWLNNNFRQEFKAILQCQGERSSSHSVQARTEYSPVGATPIQPTKSKVENPPTVIKSTNKKSTQRMTIADGDGGVWHGPEQENYTNDLGSNNNLTYLIYPKISISVNTEDGDRI